MKNNPIIFVLIISVLLLLLWNPHKKVNEDKPNPDTILLDSTIWSQPLDTLIYVPNRGNWFEITDTMSLFQIKDTMTKYGWYVIIQDSTLIGFKENEMISFINGDLKYWE